MSLIKIGAVYAVQPHMDFLEQSILSIERYVAPILISVKAAVLDGIASDALEGLSKANRVQILPTASGNPKEYISEAARLLLVNGASHLLLVDPQDVYAGRDIENILGFVAQHPDAARFQLKFHHYWKGLAYRIDPIDPIYRTIILRIARHDSHQSASEINGRNVCSIPPDIAVGHNFTYASAREFVRTRIAGSAGAEQGRTRWLEEIWEAWDGNRALRNLHPLTPERFRRAERMNACALPDAVKEHPYARYDIAVREERPTPACSLIFLATGGFETIRKFAANLADTLPDDCEVIACVSSKDPDALRFLQEKSGIRVVRITDIANTRQAWTAGVHAATADILIFISTLVEVYGDWLEGILAAFEQSDTTVYAPRIMHHHASRALLFESRRGQYNALYTIDQSFRPGTSDCWACHRDEFDTVCDAGSVDCKYVEDTLLFSPQSGESLQAIDQPFGKIPEVQSRPAASIVIPVDNNVELTKACIESIFRHTRGDQYELIVVDNGSTDGTRQYLESLQPQVRYIRNRKNLFFAKACNRGAWAAYAGNIVFLNNDTLVEHGWLDGLLSAVATDPSVGIVGNKQLFPDSHPVCPGCVWHAGIVIGTDKNPWHVFYGFDADHPLVNREYECDAVSGCCLLIRRTLFAKLQGFDSTYQNGFEDVDLCLRARELGYRTLYTPHSRIIHFVSSSESRFDRDVANHEWFRKQWADRLMPSELERFQRAGWLPPKESRIQPRVGFVSAFNQSNATSEYAGRLVPEWPEGSYIVLSEIGAPDRCSRPDSPHVIRAWSRSGHWYYPMLRYAAGCDVDIIHVNFDSALFPETFLEFLAAIRNQGKKIVVTVHDTLIVRSMLRSLSEMADAFIVPAAANRTQLVLAGCPAEKIRVIRAGVDTWKNTAKAHWRLYCQLLKTSKPVDARPHVCWEGPQMVNHSLALVNREMELALLESNLVQLSILPVGADSFASALSDRARKLETFYRRRMSSVDVHIRHQWPPNWNVPQEGRWVLIQPWEYGALPVEWVEQVNRNVDEVWVPSRFVKDLYIQSGVEPTRVHVVPNGVDVDSFKPGVEPFKLPTLKSFRFLFVGGTIHRKGADVLLRAYRRTFSAADDVVLVIKDVGTGDIYRGQGLGQTIREMQSDGNSPSIVYLDSDLSDRDMARLYNACHCLVHPYRGEGFGLPVLEAMSSGLPVIVTAGGATDDFVDDETGLRIPAHRQVFGNRVIGQFHTAGDLWLLEPEETALSDFMRHVQRNPEHAKEIGTRARAKVVEGWTWMHASQKALERIEILRRAPIVRFRGAAGMLRVEASRSPKLLYVGMLYDYGDPARGWSFEERNFFHPLQRFARQHNWTINRFDFMHLGRKYGRDRMSEMLWEVVQREQPDYLVAILFNPDHDPAMEVIARITRETSTTTINWFCDDHWRFDNYSRFVAPHFNFAVTTDSAAVAKYRSIGLGDRVIKSQWACNNELYRPLGCDKDIEISFVGQPHGNRAETIQKLCSRGFGLRVFGFGWPNVPRLPFHEMVRVFNRSYINLNLSNSSMPGMRQQIKGRNFEIPGTGGFLLTNYADNLEEYYSDRKEIVVFHSEEEVPDLVRYYLQHDSERESIAKAGFERTSSEHTWDKRWGDVFAHCEHMSQ